MKTLKAFVVAVIVVSSFPVLAQQTSAGAQSSTSATTSQAQINQSSSASASATPRNANAQGSANLAGALNGSPSASTSTTGATAAATEMRPVSGELVGKLDSKTAKVGDPVIVKTTQKTRTAEGTEIPRGSRLIGHVTQVQAHGKGAQDSSLGLQFDRAELKNGQSIAINSLIQSVAPSNAAMNAAAMGSDDMFASGPAGGGMAMGGSGGMIGGARSGGGLVGGAGGMVGGAGSLGGGATSAVGSATGYAGTRVSSTAGSAFNTTGNTAIGTGNGALRGAAAGTGSLGAHATALPGVMLAGDASGAASGMLSASNRNVHLDSGTQMVLGVSSAVVK